MRKKRSPASVYAVCINNDGYRASLEVGKLYEMIADEAAEVDGMIHVIDSSPSSCHPRSLKNCDACIELSDK